MEEETKHAGGRPTLYDPKFIDEVDNYLATATKENQHLPKVESFALWIGVNKDTLYEWKKLYKEFSDALEKIMLFQGERLIDDGIYGGHEINASIVKLMLMNNHGMVDKSNTDLTTKGDKIESPRIFIPEEIKQP